MSSGGGGVDGGMGLNLIKKSMRVGEMAQQLKAPTSLSEDPDLIPSQVW